MLLLRHAETAAPECFHGAESDVGLGDRGRLQAAAAARALAAECPAAVLSSALRRALETAAPIAAACGVAVEVVPALQERRMGPLSGRPRAEGWARYESARRRWLAGDLDATHEGGESFAQVRDRVVPAFLEADARHAGRTVVVVAHGVIIRVLLTGLLEGYGPADYERIAIDFVAVNDMIGCGSTWRAAALGVAPPGLP